MIFNSVLAQGMRDKGGVLDAHKAGSGIRLPGRGPIESKLDMNDLEVTTQPNLSLK